MNSATTAEQKTISASVARVTFHNDENGFCVLRAEIDGRVDPITVVGHAPHAIHAGELITCEGEWFTDKRYGLQFKADKLSITPPNSRDGILRYLSSGLIDGIGPHFAKRLIKAFGDEVFEVIEQEPERLRSLSGIGKKRANKIIASWQAQKSVRDIMVFLHTHGISTGRAVRIYKTYGDQAITRLKQNPYRLVSDVHGIGFKIADGLALAIGIARDSAIRAQAGLQYVLQQLSNRGHCAALQDELITSSIKLLDIEETILRHALGHEIAAERLQADTIDGKACVYLTPLYEAEVTVAENILALRGGDIPWGNIDADSALPWVESQTGLQLSDSQHAALKTMLSSKVTLLTGGPGVGKTTVINSLLRIIIERHVRVALCAPTGRAAKRLSETTGLEAKTIHRLLEFDPLGFSFKHNEDNPLAFDVVVVDESSMMDIVLMDHLLRALPNQTSLLLVGDVDQLPSVGPGKVLEDLIQSGVITTVRLTEIFRQAADSNIITNAHRVNQGLLPHKHHDDQSSDFFTIYSTSIAQSLDTLLRVVTKRIPDRLHCDPLRDIQVLTPMHRGELGSRHLNSLLQQQLNPRPGPAVERFGWRFLPGDKVIQMTNNYEKRVFNGDIGFIHHVDIQEERVDIEFDRRFVEYQFNELDEIALAYAISIHKSQGSEYPVVVIPLSMQHRNLLARNLLYTAMTRGRKMVVLIAEEAALEKAVSNRHIASRLTKLASRLQHR